MKKILVLGVGNAQVDFIRLCKKTGYTVYSCSYRNEGRGIPESDSFDLINITDVEQVKKHVIKNSIDVIYSVGSDIAMQTISQVSSDLKKKCFVGINTAITCNNKVKLRDALREVSTCKYSIKYSVLYNSEDLAKWEIFPAIVKPSNSQGQRGISKVKNHEELKKALSIAIENSQNQAAIVEEYVDGFEISVNSYMVAGSTKFIFIAERIIFDDYPGGIIKSHRFPVSKFFDENEVKKLVQETAIHLEIEDGPIYFQIKINSDGIPKIIEVTPRFDGCHLWRLIKMLNGPDLLHLTLSHLFGEVLDEEMFAQKNINYPVNAELSFFTQAPESLLDRNQFSIAKNANYVEWYYNNGESIRPINGYQEKVGYQIIIEL